MTIATIIPSLTSNPPSRANPAAFPTDGDSFLNDLAGIVSAQNTAASELTAWNSEIETFKNQSAASKTNAESSKNTALTQARNAAASQVSLWVSGTTYAVNQMVYSNADGRQYKRILAGAGTTDPSSDPTNWEPLGWEYITNYPDIRPTLDLNFAGSQAVDPRITFTRNSIATYFDKFGVMQIAGINQPRIDFDPVTGECKGLLIEEQRTNLLTYSEQFDNVSWVKSGGTITANTVVSPDGTIDADKLVENTSAGVHVTAQNVSMTSGVSYTFSIFAKAGERSRLLFERSNATLTSFTALVDLVAGDVVSTTGTVTASIAPIGNNWYRISLTVSAASTAAGGVQVDLVSTGSTVSYTGDGTSGIYIWGAQLEAGAFPTSYIPTVASQVTRSADVASMTGSNFTSWYRQDEGTVYFDNSREYVGTSIGYAITDGTLTNLTQLLLNPLDARFTVTVGGENIINLIASSTYPQALRSAFAVKSGDFARALNNQPLLTSASFAAPVASRMDIGNRLGLFQLNGHIKRLAYYPKRLPNQVLQAITQP